jgi:uncharacterized protein YndB with AHSA1/START domain
MNYNWEEFEINYYYPVGVDRLYDAWATPKGLKSFFIEEITITDPSGTERGEMDRVAAGDKYSWRWRHDYALFGTFENAEAQEALEFTFSSMLVNLKFKQLEGSSLLLLRQTNIPTTDVGRATSHLNCRVCWTFFLTNLKSVLINGTDLRDSDPGRCSSFEVGYSAKELA